MYDLFSRLFGINNLLNLPAIEYFDVRKHKVTERWLLHQDVGRQHRSEPSVYTKKLGWSLDDLGARVLSNSL